VQTTTTHINEPHKKKSTIVIYRSTTVTPIMHQPLVIMAAPTPARQRSRVYIVASLAIILLSLISSAPTVSASAEPEKKCIEFFEDYDVRNAARESNVFLIVHDKNDIEKRKDICTKVAATPQKRWSEVLEKGKAPVFAFMEITSGHEDGEGEWHEGTANFVKNSLGATGSPSFLFISKGMGKTSKYSSHVTHYNGSDMLDMSDLYNFVEKKLGFRIGNDVFNIIFFDTIAAQFISYGDATGLDRIKQRIFALYVRTATLFSYKEPFSSIGKLYNRAFAMSFEHGMDYCGKQMKKLEKKLESSKHKMSEHKIQEFHQKIAILKAFAEPKELTADDHRQLFIHGILHFGLIIASLLFFFFPGGNEEPTDEGGEAINDVPVIAKVVESDNQSAKKEK
jgi:hypothetical protein